IDKEIGKTKWFCGEELTAADIMMSFPLEAAGTRLDLDQYPNVARFVKEVHALPNYQKALEKGGPYAYA
ncbi:MAG: glutathione S-transferase family protein, partial [Myxococcota bacterium]